MLATNQSRKEIEEKMEDRVLLRPFDRSVERSGQLRFFTQLTIQSAVEHTDRQTHIYIYMCAYIYSNRAMNASGTRELSVYCMCH